MAIAVPYKVEANGALLIIDTSDCSLLMVQMESFQI